MADFYFPWWAWKLDWGGKEGLKKTDKQQPQRGKKGGSVRGEVWRGRVWVRKTVFHSEAPVTAHRPPLHPGLGRDGEDGGRNGRQRGGRGTAGVRFNVGIIIQTEGFQTRKGSRMNWLKTLLCWKIRRCNGLICVKKLEYLQALEPFSEILKLFPWSQLL